MSGIDPLFARLNLADRRDDLPVDAPTIAHEQRAEELRIRVRAAQRRRRW